LDKYLQEISKIDLITAEEEVDLAQRIKQGDEKALEKLIKYNLRFVVLIAKQYQNQGLSLPDLINEGNIGLIKAVKRIGETKDFKFISHIAWWIRQSILQALSEQARIIRLPLNKIVSINKLNKAFAELEQRYEREPTIEELASFLEIKPAEVKDTLINNIRPINVETLLSENEDSNNLLDVFEKNEVPRPDSILINKALVNEVESAITTLSYREAVIIKMYYGIAGFPQMTLEKIAEQLDLTVEQVEQIKEKAIRRLKHSSRSKLLKAYLG
jgi:RNA polymerase primary sigma factor